MPCALDQPDRDVNRRTDCSKCCNLHLAADSTAAWSLKLDSADSAEIGRWIIALSWPKRVVEISWRAKKEKLVESIAIGAKTWRRYISRG